MHLLNTDLKGVNTYEIIYFTFENDTNCSLTLKHVLTFKFKNLYHRNLLFVPITRTCPHNGSALCLDNVSNI